jgi:hypothetical protein
MQFPKEQQTPGSNPDRFLAGDPVIVPPGATEAERLRLAFPVVPPMEGSPEREAWDRLGLGNPED